MIRRIPLCLPFVALVVVVACTDKTPDVIAIDSTPPPGFVDPDAGANKADGNDLVTYCPSDRCPPGHTTCARSIHLCDVDLLTDPNNCGECGNACPNRGGGAEEYACVEGRCKLVCSREVALDCDGAPDNGCEAMLPNNDHCGACGIKCPADKPCIDRFMFDYGCGCRSGDLFCPGQYPVPGLENYFSCVDPEYDDKNCGACYNACPPAIEGREPLPNTYFGCVESKCGEPKCNLFWGDCDSLATNGCEAPLLDDDNCGACGNRCTDGAKCRLEPLGPGIEVPVCMCPEGQTFCSGGSKLTVHGEIEVGRCADLSSSPQNCGACGASCIGRAGRNMDAACVYGRCEEVCWPGWGDCNGNPRDGCETDLNADPKNCGACGRVCDGIAGQACVDGQCMVEPCDVLKDGGGPTR